MNSAEIVQKIVINSPIMEEDVWRIYPAMELYCANHRCLMNNLIAIVVSLVCCGITGTEIRAMLLNNELGLI